MMDTLGALALGTELPTPEVLLRKPYKRNASLISRPMMRNILCQTALQLSALLTLLYCGASFFNVNEHVVCGVYAVNREYTAKWDPLTREIVPSDYSTAFGTVGCADFTRYCGMNFEYHLALFKVHVCVCDQRARATNAYIQRDGSQYTTRPKQNQTEYGNLCPVWTNSKRAAFAAKLRITRSRL